MSIENENENVRRMVKAIARAEKAWKELYKSEQAFSTAVNKCSEEELAEASRIAFDDPGLLDKSTFRDLGS